MAKNKFQIGDLVGTKKTNQTHRVVGITMLSNEQLQYNLKGWSYLVSESELMGEAEWLGYQINRHKSRIAELDAHNPTPETPKKRERTDDERLAWLVSNTISDHAPHFIFGQGLHSDCCLRILWPGGSSQEVVLPLSDHTRRVLDDIWSRATDAIWGDRR